MIQENQYISWNALHRGVITGLTGPKDTTLTGTVLIRRQVLLLRNKFSPETTW
jgi:hypothetical protein